MRDGQFTQHATLDAISLPAPWRVSGIISRLNHDVHLAKTAAAAGLVLACEWIWGAHRPNARARSYNSRLKDRLTPWQTCCAEAQ
jgi:hypothetical protein